MHTCGVESTGTKPFGANSRIGFLMRNILFENLDDAALEDMSARFVVREHDRHQYILFQGMPPYALMIIQEGYVKIVKESGQGKEILVELLGPGDVIDAVAIIEGRPHLATACAMDRTTLLVLPRNEFLSIIEHNPKVAVQALIAVGDRLRHAYEVLQRLAARRIEPRIANVLLMLAGRAADDSAERVVLQMRLTRKDIADMVGAAPETTIRIMSRWEKAGIVVRDNNNYIAIEKVSQLRRIALEENVCESQEHCL
ncbi:MAG: Crp/Fnr family transcriptional regulator [Armatimonadetes bacterium]|nr:Crp/Fnr family transcriptional regulator [Armatimonadota bacterium]